MIRGVGIDSVEIARVAKICGRSRFLERIFNKEEREEFQQRGNPIESIAGSFAAKEAISKALGEPLRMAHWKQMMIRRVNGCPTAELSGEMKDRMMDLGGEKIWISISHNKTCAIALAMMEG